ncbi:hypothetical protein [Nitrosomonas sp. Nm132]|uniref:hypothetical protein n=1 Tax=Nitrosomonas sp. Nm132 TaxID=1881053 RepID=UPI0015A4DC5E|nr:hypothetical protein [Nitrosomonas sp. Nm132]
MQFLFLSPWTSKNSHVDLVAMPRDNSIQFNPDKTLTESRSGINGYYAADIFL